jgi:hypothetical protein
VPCWQRACGSVDIRAQCLLSLFLKPSKEHLLKQLGAVLYILKIIEHRVILEHRCSFKPRRTDEIGKEQLALPTLPPHPLSLSL